MSESRSKQRLQRKLRKAEAQAASAPSSLPGTEVKKNGIATSDEKFAKLLARNEDELLSFVAKINKLYQVSNSTFSLSQV
jgi:hypothetical protein